MNKLWLTLVLLAAAVIASPGALASDNPFVGTWKLNPARSHYAGWTYTMKQKPDGTIHLVDGSVAYDFKLDGKDYPTIADRTTSWTKTGDSTYSTTLKAGGKVLSHSERVLSADGKTMTVTITGTHQDGSSFRVVETFQKTAGGAGLDGTWKDTRTVVHNQDTMVVSSTMPGTMRVEYGASKTVAEGKLDGSPIKVTGPIAPPGATGTWKMPDAHTLDYTHAIQDKITSQGSEKISADGKTLTDTNWDPAAPTEKTVAVWEKN
jgi:polyisoprenoid-binding protein YceI